jgi:hypothetical protein
VNSWQTGALSTVAEITVKYGGVEYKKLFTISAVKDAPGAIVLDIDCAEGLSFTPTNRSVNKTLAAKLYNSDGTPPNDLIPSAQYEYAKWYKNGTLITSNSGGVVSGYNTANLVINRNAVAGAAQFRCEVKWGDYIRSRTVLVNDVTDGRTKTIYTENENVTAYHKPPDSVAVNDAGSFVNVTTGATSATWSVTYGGVTVIWKTSSANAVFSAQGQEKDAKHPTTGINYFDWRDPVKIKGEKGVQGDSGMVYYMFKQNGTTVPAPNASISAMKADGWKEPKDMPNEPVYMTAAVFRIINEGTGKNVDVNGKLLDSAAPIDPWATPKNLTGTDGKTVVRMYKANNTNSPTGTLRTINQNIANGWGLAPARYMSETTMPGGYGNDTTPLANWSSVFDTVGASAPEVRIQYSADGLANWSTTPNQFIRFSTDNGTTWSQAYKFKGDKGDQGDPAVAWVDPAWITVTIGTNQFKYRKDTQGRVWFKGMLARVGDGIFWTFPVGYRPARRWQKVPVGYYVRISTMGGMRFTVHDCKLAIETYGDIRLIVPERFQADWIFESFWDGEWVDGYFDTAL